MARGLDSDAGCRDGLKGLDAAGAVCARGVDAVPALSPSDDNSLEVPETDRLRAIVDAGVALASELSLDAVLQKIVETATELTGAQYAALGVIDPSGQALERFVVTGIDEETQAAIGDPPHGRGILGALIHDAKPLRLDNLADDPRSVGFPPNHPPMGTFLGVPILLRGVAYGNLYLTEKEGGALFTAEDEELVQLLSAQAAVAIENAVYEAATRWLKQLESLDEIASALVSEVDIARVLDTVASRLRELIHARSSSSFCLPPTEDWSSAPPMETAPASFWACGSTLPPRNPAGCWSDAAANVSTR